jgi:protocatechuate 3,4-dioxygenase beta subunit
MHSPIRVLCLFLFAALLTAQNPPAGDKPATPPPEVKITGRVVTWDGKPIAGAVLRYEPTRQHLTAELLRAPHTTSNADGTFELVRRPPARGETVTPQLFVAAKGMAAVSRYVNWTKKEGQAQMVNGMVQIVDEDGDEIWVDASHPMAAGVGGAREPEYAPETKLDDIVLATGTRLTGRVRDEAGKPLAGVRVVALDLLEQGNALRGGRSFGFYAAAESDAGGIFTVPGTLPFGVLMQFQLDGYHRERLDPVDISTSLELTMRAGGHVSGRVVDHEGRSVADAMVRIGYELGSIGTSDVPVKSAADGTFRINLDRPGRWRATATRKVEERQETAHSAVHAGPKQQIEIAFKAPGKDEQQQFLPIRVVAKGSGKPISGFRAASVWEEYANQNNNYLEYRLRYALRDAKASKDGKAEVRGPGKNQPHAGVVRVVAPGFAPFTKKEIEWKEPEGDAKPEPILAELEDEATVRGRLVDETSGAPVVGAKVWAQPRQDPNQGTYNDGSGPPSDAVTTAADGSFHLRSLGEGAWEIVVRDPKRPKAPNKEVDLAVGEQKADLTISLPSGASVAGKLTGTAIGHGTKVFLSRLPKQTFGEAQNYYSYYGNSEQTAGTPADVDAEGNFRFEGVALANHLLVVRQPSPPRHGGDLYLPLEPFRVRGQGLQREFDCGEDRPGTIRGAISFANATVPHERLVVVARLVNEDNNNRVFYSYNPNYPGPRAFVDRDGAYELRVGPGTYQLLVVDLGTALLLHNETKKIEVPTGGIAERDLKLELTAIEVEIKPAADVKEPALFERLEIRIVPKAQKDGNRFGGNDNYDTGAGVRWPLGAAKQTLVLPLGDATFFCRSQVANLRIDDNRWENPPVGRAEFEIATGQGAKTTCTIEVGAPPEVPDPDKKDKAGEAGEEPAADGGKK